MGDCLSKGSPSTENPVADEKWPGEKLHSKIRWNKIDEVEDILKRGTSVNIKDPKNGNQPIHISAQNGFVELTELLLKKGANVDAQNNKDNTALHMAMEYDCYWCAVSLITAGADKSVTNCDGFKAITGINGEQALSGFMAFTSAHNSNHLIEALKMILEEKNGDIIKSDLVQAWLKHKKERKECITDETQTKFKEVMACPELFKE